MSEVAKTKNLPFVMSEKSLAKAKKAQEKKIEANRNSESTWTMSQKDLKHRKFEQDAKLRAESEKRFFDNLDRQAKLKKAKRDHERHVAQMNRKRKEAENARQDSFKHFTKTQKARVANSNPQPFFKRPDEPNFFQKVFK